MGIIASAQLNFFLVLKIILKVFECFWIRLYRITFTVAKGEVISIALAVILKIWHISTHVHFTFLSFHINSRTYVHTLHVNYGMSKQNFP